MSKRGDNVLSVSFRKMHEKRERKNVTVALLVGLIVLIIAFANAAFTGFVIETSECGVLDSPGETYVLMNDISASGTCFTIGADNITLDCDGYTITGGHSGNGVEISGRQGVTVQNCVITTFENGIHLLESSSNSITSNTLDSNNYGIYLQGSPAKRSSNNIITSNYASANEYHGIYIWYGSNNHLADNYFNTNFNSGIRVDYGEYNTIIDNDVSANTNYGIALSYSTGNNVTNNEASSIDYFGINDAFGSSNTFIGNRANSNGYYGVYIRSSSNTIIEANTIKWNNQYGIRLLTSPDTVVRNNNIYDNSLYQFYSDSPIELSYEQEGNYWGRTSSPYFVAGTDTNIVDAVDSWSYNVESAWTQGILPIVEEPVAAATGGIVQSAGGGMTVDIPAGVLSEDLTVTVSEKRSTIVVSTNKGSGKSLMSFDISPAGAVFSQPVEVTFDYSSVESSIVNENKIDVYLYNPTTQKWDSQSATCDTNANICTVWLTHFSEWSIIEEEEAPVPEEVCGNGVIEGAEECDDGNANDGDGCDMTCIIEPDYTCTGEPSVCVSVISCGQTITSDIIMGNDLLNCPATAHGLAIGANDITLDCNGHTIDGTDVGSYGGIYNYGFDGVTIKNCVITDYYAGISLQNAATYNKLINNDISSGGRGIDLLDGSNYNALDGNKVHDQTSGQQVYGIWIRASLNNNLTGNTISAYWRAIQMEQGSNNNIITNNIANASTYGGIYVIDSANNILTGNTANKGDGIVLSGSGSKNNIVKNNIVTAPGGNAIYIYLGSNNTVTENIVSSSGSGIRLYTASGNTLTSNNASSNYYGIYIHSSSNNNTIADNIVNASSYTGVLLESSASNTITGNRVDGIQIGGGGGGSNNNILTNNIVVSPAVAGGRNGIYIYLGSGNMVIGNTVSLSSIGLRLHTASNNTLTNNNVYNNIYGIHTYLSSYNNISQNTVNSNTYAGIYIESSSNYNTLANNTAGSNTNAGIWLYNGANYNVLINNIANSNYGTGIYLWSNSNNNTLISNTASSNSGNGISLSASSNSNSLISNIANSNANGYGIVIASSTNNNITSNTANSNTYSGIYVASSSNNTVIKNNASLHINGYGIRIYYSSDNSFAENNLYSNKYGFYLENSNTSRIYHNNIYNGSIYKVYSNGPIELSYNGQGNFWGRTTAPYFIAGTDSNAANVVDSYPYSSANAWNIVCGPHSTNVGGNCVCDAGWVNLDNNWTTGCESTQGCGQTITTNTVLSKDYSCYGNAFTIGANNITLDCAGHAITGYGTGRGVSGSGQSATVKNCIFANFTNAVSFGTARNTIVDNKVLSAMDNCLVLNYRAPAYNLVRGNEVSNCGAGGIYIDGSNNTIVNNRIENAGLSTLTLGGLSVIWGSGNVIENNVILNESGRGTPNAELSGSAIWLGTWGAFANTIVRNNTIDRVTSNIGIVIRYGSPGYTVEGNTIINVKGAAISADSANSTFMHNIVSNSGGIGVGGTGSTISENTIINNNGGISYSGASGRIVGNVLSNSAYGIEIRGTGIVISGNRLENTGVGNWTLGQRCLGSAVNILSSSQNIVENNVITGTTCDASWGSWWAVPGGIAVGSSSNNNTVRNNTVTNNRGHGIYLVESLGNQVIGNTIFNNTEAGVWTTRLFGTNIISDNDIFKNKYGLLLQWYYTSNPLTVYHNDIYNNTVRQVQSDYPIELSYNNEGNWWGKTISPCFVAGTDSNRADAKDSYPFCVEDGWKVPVAVWHFDSCAGTVVADSSGNGNDGTLMNGVLWTAGYSNQGLQFDGIDDYVFVGAPTSLAFSNTTPQTIEAWVLTSNPNKVMLIAGKPADYQMHTLSDGRIRYTGPAGVGIDSTWALQANTLTHVAGVFDPSATGSERLKVYINGNRDPSTSQQWWVAGSPSSNPFQIGGWQGYAVSWQGLIDEMQIYKYAKTAGEIAADAAIAPNPMGCCMDNDNDGYYGYNVASCSTGNDCNDNNALIYPGAEDLTCNGIDENCNGIADDEYVPTVTNCGIGGCASTGQLVCENGATRDTCTQGEPTTEICDNIDNDCDGLIDAADSNMLITPCDLQAGVCTGSQHIAAQCVEGGWQQCTATEYGSSYGNDTCPDDGIDNNCDGEAVLDCTALCDKDSDGYKPDDAPWYCLWPFYLANDCNDFNALINAGATEVCNGIDDNCFNGVDDGIADIITDIYEYDDVGECKTQVEQCSEGALHIIQDAVGPIAEDTLETCIDGKDNDCDGLIDLEDNDCDSTPPVTIDDYPFNDVWSNLPNALVTLNATDEGFGVAQTAYAIDGAPGIYSIPLAFNADGAYNLTYHSTDIIGNVEEQKQTIIKLDSTAPSINLSITGDSWTGCSAGGWFFWLVWFVDSGDVTYPLAHGCVKIDANINADISGLHDYTIKLYDPDNNLVKETTDSSLNFNFDTLMSSYRVVVEANDNANNYATEALQVYEDDDQDYIPDMLDLCPTIKPAQGQDVNPKDGCPDQAGVPSEAWGKCIDIYSGAAATSLNPISATNSFTGETIVKGDKTWYGFDSSIASSVQVPSYINMKVEDSSVTQCSLDLKSIDALTDKGKKNYFAVDKDVKIKEEDKTGNYILQEIWKLDLSDGSKIRANQQYNENEARSKIHITYENKDLDKVCSDSCETTKKSCLAGCAALSKNQQSGCKSGCESADKSCKNDCRDKYNFNFKEEYTGMKTVSLYDILKFIKYA